MKEVAEHLFKGYGGRLISAETDGDHMHILAELPPQACVSSVIRNLKGQLSREVHLHPVYGPYVKRFLYGDAPLWSSSYFVATAGSVSLETVKNYIESQRTDEHKRKYDKRSRYWEGKGKSRS